MKPTTLKDRLKGKLNDEELKLLPSALDLLGSREKAVAIIEIPKELNKKAKLIAESILQMHKNVKTVLVKASEREGVFRTRKLKWLAGEKNCVVAHKEYGCLFKLDPKKVYFSQRESTERQRIAEQVKPRETVIVMFSGVAPYAVIIAKKQPLIEKVYAVELNPEGHKFAEENVRINHLGAKVFPLLGDVKEVCPKLGIVDRIIMPLPKGAYQFLNLALSLLNKGGVLHFYYWGSEPNLFLDAEKIVNEEAKKMNKKIIILNEKKVLPYGPKKWKIVLDVLVC
ncbi:class I SAM-dependent methyltransferase family protein [Candidatus Woesearchaeota archaeon]|nr:class I SAM-dependent methyltransferase family protein [Candidatus Woesearchaeota archaeon]